MGNTIFRLGGCSACSVEERGMKLSTLIFLLFVFSINTASGFSEANYVALTLPSTVVGVGSRSTLENGRETALKVEKILIKDGIKNRKIITAILVNMWHESSWIRTAKSGSCVGLFQLHTKYSGRGMTYEELTNINHHMYRLISLDVYKKWKSWARNNIEKSTCGYMAFRFASDVERCAVQHRRPREVTANRWWKALEPLIT